MRQERLRETLDGASLSVFHITKRPPVSKNYFAIEIGVLAALTAVLMGIPELGGWRIVAPLIVIAWVALQLVSSVAFCNAIDKGKIVVFRGSRGSKETYGIAKGARPGWLVMRHIWTYKLISEEKRTASL